MKQLFTLLLLVGFASFGTAQVTSFPYTEDFEAGPGGWTVDNGVWELATPANPVINAANSGDSAWITNATGDYPTNFGSSVTSPVLDLSGLDRPVINLAVWWNSEFGWDGAVLQYKTTVDSVWRNIGEFGGAGGTNWYTDNDVNGLDNIQGSLRQGWSGRGTGATTGGSGGYVNASNSLDSIAGEASVQLRVSFGSDGSVTDDGFAFDDVSIFNLDPIVSMVSEAVTGDSSVGLCAGDMMSDSIFFATNANNNFIPYNYIITDEMDNILAVLPNGFDVVDFDGTGAGVCHVYGVSYLDSLATTLDVAGQNIFMAALSTDTFVLSSNYLEVRRYDVADVTTSTVAQAVTGATWVGTCAGDGVDDFLSFSHVGGDSGSYAYVVTDTNNVILGTPPGNMVNFEPPGPGICRVWGLSYNGMLADSLLGENAAMVDLATGCFELSSNFVVVYRSDFADIDGGTVSAANGDTAVYTCAGDGNDDFISFAHVTTSTMSSYRYIVTDDNNMILGTPPGNMVNFEPPGPGVCRVWGLSFNGDFDTTTNFVGMDATTALFTDGCFELSSNYLEVSRGDFSTIDGGDVTEMGTGATTVGTCAGDGNDDFVMFQNNSTGTANYAYVVTDDMNNILAIPPGNMVNFEPPGPGVCRVWGLSYTGSLLDSLAGNDAAATTFTDGCFELSSTFLTVSRYDYSEIDAGTVAEATGIDTIHICAQDSVEDFFDFTNTGAGTANYSYVVTDDMNNILAFSSGTANFNGAPAGNCRVWGLSYNGDLDSTLVGSDAAASQLASGCFELSSNYVPVNRWSNAVDGGTVAEMGTGADMVGTCAGDGDADVVLFENTSTATGANYAYVVTDDNNMILAIPPANMADFEGAGAGICRVWGLSYTGPLADSLVGMDAANTQLSYGCFALSSNFITVTRYDAADIDAGTISDSDTGNDTTMVMTVGDGNPDIVNFTSTSTSAEDMAYIITDDNGDVINVVSDPMADFEGAGVGVCFVYALSYNGDLNNPQGENVSSASFATGCFEVSANWLTVIRTSSVGLDELTNDLLTATVYPSPAVDNIRIEGLDNNTTYVVEVINTLGAVVATDANYNQNSAMSISGLESGIYFVNIFSNKERVAVGRFVKK